MVFVRIVSFCFLSVISSFKVFAALEIPSESLLVDCFERLTVSSSFAAVKQELREQPDSPLRVLRSIDAEKVNRLRDKLQNHEQYAIGLERTLNDIQRELAECRNKIRRKSDDKSYKNGFWNLKKTTFRPFVGSSKKSTDLSALERERDRLFRLQGSFKREINQFKKNIEDLKEAIRVGSQVHVFLSQEDQSDEISEVGKTENSTQEMVSLDELSHFLKLLVLEQNDSKPSRLL